MNNYKAVVSIENIPEQFNWDAKKYPLLSFLGFILHKASLASSKDLTQPLTVTINGKSYQFKNKVVSVKSESLPKVEKIDFNGNLKESLKVNFVGFALTTILQGLNNFTDINFSKDTNVNVAAKKVTSIVGLALVSLERYKEANAFARQERESIKVLCVQNQIGINTKAYTEAAKNYKLQYNNLITAPKISAAAVKNAATKKARVSKKAAAAAIA